VEGVAVRARGTRGVPRSPGESSERDAHVLSRHVLDQSGQPRQGTVRTIGGVLDQQSLHGRGMASSGVVLHVGSHMGSGFETALPQMAEAFKRALDAADSAPPGVEDCPILIENAAGTGGTVGRSLDEIQALIDATGGDERIGLCIDTQHLWASGIDYSSTHGTSKLVNEIDMRIGLDRLRCFHLNDSKIELGGNRDRHANIDEGTIGTMGLAALVGHPDFRDLPLLLEVPGAGDGPRVEDVIAARKVVVEGIRLYDGSVPPELEAMVLAMPPAAKKSSVKKKPIKKSLAKKSAAKSRQRRRRREESTSEEDAREEDGGKEDAREEDGGKEDARQEDGGKEDGR